MRTVRHTLHVVRIAPLPLALALLLALALAGCRDDHATLRLDAADAGSAVTLRPGDTLAIALSGNPTTGFHWEVLELDPRVLRLTDAEDFDPDSDAEGAGGRVTITFEALAPGSTPLRLGYQAEYETNPVPSETFAVDVTVED